MVHFGSRRQRCHGRHWRSGFSDTGADCWPAPPEPSHVPHPTLPHRPWRTAASFPTPPPLHLTTIPFPCDTCGAKCTVWHLKAVPSPTRWLSSGLWLLLGACPSPLLPQGLEKIRDNIDKIATFFNGDIRRPRLVHYERACGLCKDRKEAIENMTAAAQLCGLIPPGVAINKRNQTTAPRAHTHAHAHTCFTSFLLPRL